MNELLAQPPVDLTNCDREPIHIPGAILPHGAMIVVDADFVIRQVAGNTYGLLGIASEGLCGMPLRKVFSDAQIERIRNLVSGSALTKPSHVLDPALRVVVDRPIDASIHISDGAVVIEVEDADLADRNAQDPLSCVQRMLDGLGDAGDLQAYCQMAAQRVREATGYDRVMIYRFMGDDSGWVFAEAKLAELAPFLDLHYPASDIPRQARAMYLTSWLRVITAVDYKAAPLVPSVNPTSGKPLDMSQATLRDVSPIHREYLRNMGVGASMSISIIREGKLWGLIACHHNTPRKLPRHLRAACELFGAMFSLQLEARLRAEQYESRLESRKLLGTLMQELASEDDYAAGLVARSEALLDYISAGGLAIRADQSRGGMAIRVNSGLSTIGATPSDDQIAELSDWLANTMQDFDGIFVTDRLSEVWPPAAAFADVASGLLAVSISREPRDFILWFRPEITETVTWAGDPRKPVESGPLGDRLTPRKSFEAWSETVHARSTPWADADNDAAFDLRVSLLEVVLRRIDAAARERLRAWEQEQMLMAELDHRVKNTLANIQALVAQTGRSAKSLEDFTEGLERRIRSMSRAHSLLTESRWEAVSIADIVSEELAAHQGHGELISIDGPAAFLKPKAALALSLAIHELVTNAAKYGALSVSDANLRVAWETTADGGIALEWIERGGPPVIQPRRRGFGSTLIERALATETGGTSKMNFRPEGVTCIIDLPPSAVQRIDRANVSPQPAATSIPSTRLPTRTCRILLIEDSSLVLMLLENIVEDLGWDVVGSATRLDQALGLARSAHFDAALLDINLDDEMTWPVAAILHERQIPFLFTTGYDSTSTIPPEFSAYGVVGKPFSEAEIVSGLHDLLPNSMG